MNTKVKHGTHEWYEHVVKLVEELLELLDIDTTVEDFKRLADEADDEESRDAFMTIARTFRELSIMIDPNDKVMH